MPDPALNDAQSLVAADIIGMIDCRSSFGNEFADWENRYAMTGNSDQSEAVLFIDTNAFIQLRDLKDLPWGDLIPGTQAVCLMVARPVIEELDRFKSGTNARRRKRAGLALKLIDEASRNADNSILLKEAPIPITMQIAPRTRPDWEELDMLDPAIADDRLVAAAHGFGNGPVIFSHDSGPRIAARDIGLEALEPPEDWLLPPEQSDEQRKIGKLEREVRALRESKPELKIEFPQANENGEVILYRPRLPIFDEVEAKRLAQLYLQENPEQEVPVTVYPFGHRTHFDDGFDQQDADQYRNEYSQFRSKVAEYFRKLHETIRSVGLAPNLHFQIENTGGGSAEQLIVSVAVEDNLGILADQDDIDTFIGSSALPEPPDLPEPRSVISLPSMTPLISPRESRDPTAMRWYDRPKLGEKAGSYGCENFRPGGVFRDTMGIFPATELPATGVFSVTAGANDLTAKTTSVAVRVEEKEMQWHDDPVFELLPSFIQDNLKS